MHPRYPTRDMDAFPFPFGDLLRLSCCLCCCCCSALNCDGDFGGFPGCEATSEPRCWGVTLLAFFCCTGRTLAELDDGTVAMYAYPPAAAPSITTTTAPPISDIAIIGKSSPSSFDFEPSIAVPHASSGGTSQLFLVKYEKVSFTTGNSFA